MMKIQMINDLKVLAGLAKRKNGTKLKNALRKATTEGATMVHKRVVDKIRAPGQGRVYGKHTASAPGDPPATDLGALVKSISIVAASAKGYGYVATVSAGGNNAPYAGWLEFGTQKIEPRPFFYSSMEELKGQINKLIMDACMDNLSEGT